MNDLWHSPHQVETLAENFNSKMHDLIMNELVKRDLADIAQVNIPSWSVIGWLHEWPAFVWLQNLTGSEINNAIQGYGASFLMLITIAFTLFKFYKAFQHFQWSKQDRMEEQT